MEPENMLASITGLSEEDIINCVLDCVEAAVRYVQPNDECVLSSIHAARKFMAGELDYPIFKLSLDNVENVREQTWIRSYYKNYPWSETDVVSAVFFCCKAVQAKYFYGRDDDVARHSIESVRLANLAINEMARESNLKYEGEDLCEIIRKWIPRVDHE